ncbi:dTDP-glucose 4,6-dehydratase [Bacillus sp. CGMCC 1.16541]|uniref:dTDP-glucose 4,6-dehydratase n=1 Tax=Bacillus sp. CGMCC 1.16541 TaxID=2185143 RepID=UPI000D72A084|nr:dTDP-glucose 4,6-dehydratase [Bacillus sp. CGMCC 1.16541]
MNILVTGGAGFIGSNFIRYMQKAYPHYQIVNYDLLTYAGNVESVKDLAKQKNYTFVKGDITNHELVNRIVKSHSIDTIVNFAAESHVDRSIKEPGVFVKSNVLGTQVLLDVAKNNHVKKYVQVSTDEVYGSLGEQGYFTEETSLAPNSPYSASKAGADMMVRAYYETFGLHVNITRCSNNYGPYQFPEKFVPRMITHALAGKKLPIYGDGKNVRDWLHVKDHCSAIDLVLHKGKQGEVYNIGGQNERTNNEVVQFIVEKVGASPSLITFVEDRLGHDYRYAIDATKIRSTLGWEPVYTFEQGMSETISWYINHPQWWKCRENVENVCGYKKR